MPKAAEAVPVMQELLGRDREPEFQVRASLWLGQYHYGNGETEAALGFFESTEQIETVADLHSRRGFWIGQCRNLLGRAPADVDVPVAATNRFDFLASLSHGDALIRSGKPLEAMRSYLSLEGEARSFGMLGLLYYRVGLIIGAATASGGDGGLFDWKTLDNWQPVVASAPERGLVAALARSGEAALGSSPAAKETPATDFAEVPQAPPPADILPEAEDPPPAPDRIVEPEETVRHFVIQLGAYRKRDTARKEMERLTVRGLSVRLEEGIDDRGELIYRIRLGREATREGAEGLAERLLRGMDYQIIAVVR